MIVYFTVAYMFLALINREDYTQTKTYWLLVVGGVNGILTRTEDQNKIKRDLVKTSLSSWFTVNTL